MSHIPIIFLTARTETGDIVKGFEAGGSDYITKPFKTPELLARIKMHAEIKTLRGLIPICAGCKDIRDGNGEWHALEAYIQKHSLAVFSHSMCPKCVEKHYENQEWYRNK